jgi:branched-chain amino acid transport system substrate-binding protein
MEDTRALTLAMTLGLAAEGVKTWFLVTPDEVVGNSFQTDAVAAIENGRGRILGLGRYPPDSTGFKAVLTAARDSGADAIGLCAFGTQLQAQIREARGLGLFEKSKVCAYAGCIRDVHAVGSLEARDLWLVSGFHWNRNERTRSFSQRFNGLTGRMPDKPYAATYAAVGHFLRMVESSDTIGGAALNMGMRREPVYFFGANGRFRVDGTLLLDVGLYRVKPSDQVTEDWDYYQTVRAISASDVFRPAARAACPLAP